MATQRYISTSFWDDEWIQTLDPSEKLLYLYYMTNPLTNIAGVYKITPRRISFDTGFNTETINYIMQKFEKAGKVYRFGEYIIIPTWPKHQKWEQKSAIYSGIIAVLKTLDEEVLHQLYIKNYSFDLSKVGYTPQDPPMNPPRSPHEPSYSDLDSDSDIDTDTDLLGAVAPSKNPKPTPDPLYQAIFQSFIGKVGAFTNYPKEAQAIKRIIKYCEQHAPRYTNGDKVRLAESVITTFWSLTQNGSTFWRGQPFTPSALSVTGIFDRVLVEIGQSTPGGSNDIPDF